MKAYTRNASVLWLGTRLPGNGAITTPSGVLSEAPYACGSEIKRKGTSPAELVAAAHAGSFSMTLASELTQAGFCPRQIDTTATVTMENIVSGWTMTQIHLDVTATVPIVAQCEFVDAALRAKANCPISRSLNANISMRAILKPALASVRLPTRRNPIPPRIIFSHRKKRSHNGRKPTNPGKAVSPKQSN